jgi:hypothetical protein
MNRAKLLTEITKHYRALGWLPGTPLSIEIKGKTIVISNKSEKATPKPSKSDLPEPPGDPSF